MTCSGKSESITITNEKGRLSQEEIDRMVAEAEQFAAEDEVQRKRIEALNSLSSFVYGLRTQVGDEEGLGGKISDEDKKTILSTIKEATEWIDDNSQSASVEDLEEKLAGMYLDPEIHQDVLLTHALQRSKVSSTLSPPSFTAVAAALLTMMMMSPSGITTSYRLLNTIA
jgi:hypothetical protein